MKKNYLFAMLLLVAGIASSQTVLTINGAASGTPTLFIKNGAFLNVSGGININQNGSPAGAANDYLQNNGTITLVTDTTPGQSDFTNNVNGLNTYTSGQTTGKVVFGASSITQNVSGSGSVQFMNVTTANSSSPTLNLDQNVTVNGILTIGGATAIIDSSTLTLNGTLAATGTITGSSTSNLTINGSGNLGSALTFANGGQTLGNLVVNRSNSSGQKVLLGSNLSVLDTLNISNGILDLLQNNLTLPAAGILTGSPYTSGNMIEADSTGQFMRGVSSGAGSYIYPIGDGTPAYSPATLNFSANSNAGTIGLNVKPFAHPQINNPSPAVDYLRRYWTFSNTGVSSYTYTGSFQYLPGDIVGTESAIKLNRWNNPWSGYPGSSASSDVLTITSALDQTLAPLTGDFTGRNINCTTVPGTISATSNAVCSGSPDSLSVSGSTGTVQWQSAIVANNFSDISGATSVTYITPSLTQSTYYRVIASANSCSDSSAALQIVVNPLPATPILNPSDTTICSNDSARICVSGSYSSYLWNDNETTSCIFGSEAGDYYVKVTGSNGCANTSAHASIATHSQPSVSIEEQGDTLSSFGENGYQWYLNNNPISGATSAVYVVQQDGFYSVMVTDGNGCTAISSQLHWPPLGIHELNLSDEISLYPNPVSTSTLQLKINGEWSGYSYEIYDVSGRRVACNVIRNEKTEMDVSILSSGFYTIGIKQDNNILTTVKFVKE